VNWVDIALLAVILLFGVRGYFRGLFREVLSLAGLVAGFVLAARYGENAAALVSRYWSDYPLILNGAAFVVIFFVVYLLFSLGGWWLHRYERVLFLRTVNRAGGILVGFGKGAALTALALVFLTSGKWLPHATREKMQGAYLVTPLSRLAEEIIRIGKNRVILKNNGAASVQSAFPLPQRMV